MVGKWLKIGPIMPMEITPHLFNTEGEHLEQVVLVLDKYLVEGESWLQNTNIVVGLIFSLHLYGAKTTHRIEKRST